MTGAINKCKSIKVDAAMGKNGGEGEDKEEPEVGNKKGNNIRYIFFTR